MKKILLIITGIIIVSVVLFGIYKLSTFSLFDDKPKEIRNITVPNKGYELKILQILSNATMEGSVQVRKIDNGIEETLGNYERFNHLNDYTLSNDTLTLIISNTDDVSVKPQEEKIILPK